MRGGGPMLIRLPARAAPLAGRAAVGLLVLTALALLLLACNGKGGRDADGTNTTNGNKDAEKILRQVVLQQADVPSGLQASDEQLTTNEQLIASSPDPKAARREVDEWGRILAFEATFQPEPDAPPDMAVQAISSSASLYGDAAGAGLSYAKAERSIDETDWKSQHPELQDFQQQIVKKGGLADELVWLRLSGVSPTLN